MAAQFIKEQVYIFIGERLGLLPHKGPNLSNTQPMGPYYS
jgi:hypothetical protein